MGKNNSQIDLIKKFNLFPIVPLLDYSTVSNNHWKQNSNWIRTADELNNIKSRVSWKNDNGDVKTSIKTGFAFIPNEQNRIIVIKLNTATDTIKLDGEESFKIILNKLGINEKEKKELLSTLSVRSPNGDLYLYFRYSRDLNIDNISMNNINIEIITKNKSVPLGGTRIYLKENGEKQLKEYRLINNTLIREIDTYIIEEILSNKEIEKELECNYLDIEEKIKSEFMRLHLTNATDLSFYILGKYYLNNELALRENIKNRVYKVAEKYINNEISYWIKNTERGRRVVPGYLSQHISNVIHFEIIKTHNGKGVFMLYDAGVYKQSSDDEIKKIISRYIPRELRTERIIEDTFKLLKYEKEIKQENDFEGDEWIINFKNGLLDLKQNKFKPHTHKYLSNIQLNVVYDETADKCEVFDKYLDDLTQGFPMRKTMLLQILGLKLSNFRGGRLKKLLYLKGAPDSGKSKILEIGNKMIGDKFIFSTQFNKLSERFTTAQLYGKRCITDGDMASIEANDISMIKKLMGEDYITDQFKNGGFITFKYRGIMEFASNNWINIFGEQDLRIFNRFIVLECNNVIKKENQNRDLVKNMFNEAPAIVNKALLALKELIKNNFILTEFEGQQEMFNNFMKHSNSIYAYMSETYYKDSTSNQRYTTEGMYRDYKQYCAKNGYRCTVTKHAFSSAIKSLGYTPINNIGKHKLNGYTEIRLKQ